MTFLPLQWIKSSASIFDSFYHVIWTFLLFHEATLWSCDHSCSDLSYAPSDPHGLSLCVFFSLPFSPWISFPCFCFLLLSVDSDQNGTRPHSSARAESAPRKVEGGGAAARLREEEGKKIRHKKKNEKNVKHERFACSSLSVVCASAPACFCVHGCKSSRTPQVDPHTAYRHSQEN